MLAANMAATGNMRMFSQSIGNPMAGGSYSAPPATPSPLTSAANIMGMATQRPAMPGSPEAGLQGQQMGLGVMGAVMSPQTPIVGQVYQNMQQQSMFNQAINQQMTFARPGGFGFNFPQMQAMSGFVGGQAGRDPRYTQQQMFGLAGGGMQMGMFQGTRSVQQFQQQFKQLLNSVEQVTKIMGGTLEEGLQHINRMRGMGVFQRGDQLRMTQNVMGLAAGGGVPVNQLMQFGGQMAQALRPMGVQGPAGVQLGAQVLANVGAAQKGGAFSEQQLWQATGLQGVAGQQAFAGRLVQMGAKSLSRGNQRLMAAAFVDPTSGQFDEEAWQQYRSGGMGLGEVQRQAHQNIQQMGGAIAWKANESQIRGEYLKGTQGMGWVHTLRQQLGQHMYDPNKAKILLQKYTGATREEAGMLHSYMQKLPMIEQEQKEAADIQREFQAKQQQWEARSPEMAQARMKKKISGYFDDLVGKPMRSIVEAGEKALADSIANYSGMVTTQISEGMRKQVGQMAGTAGGAAQLAKRDILAESIAPTTAEPTGVSAERLASAFGRRGTGLAGIYGRIKTAAQEAAGGGITGFLEGIAAAGMTAYGEGQRLTEAGAPIGRWKGFGEGGATQMGLGKMVGARSFASVESAKAVAAAAKGGMVIKGPKGRFGVFTPDAKKGKQLDQLSGGGKGITFTFDDWGINEQGVDALWKSLGGELRNEIKDAAGAGDIAKAARLLKKKFPKKSDTVLMAIAAKKGGVEPKDVGFTMMGGEGYGTLLEQSGNAVRDAAKAADGISAYEIETWVKDSEINELLQKAQSGDSEAFSDLATLAEERNDDSLRDFVGQMETNPELKGSVGQAAAKQYQAVRKKYRDIMGKEAKGIMKLRPEEFGKKGNLVEMLQSAKDIKAMSTGEEGASGTQADMERIMSEWAWGKGPKAISQMAAAIRGKGGKDAAKAAARLEMVGGAAVMAKKGQGKLKMAAAGQLAAGMALTGKERIRYVKGMVGGGQKARAMGMDLAKAQFGLDILLSGAAGEVLTGEEITEKMEPLKSAIGAFAEGPSGLVDFQQAQLDKELEKGRKPEEAQLMKFDPADPIAQSLKKLDPVLTQLCATIPGLTAAVLAKNPPGEKGGGEDEE